MLFDPTLVDRVYADPQHALAGLDLTSAECLYLVKMDKRRWQADALRSARSLHGLAMEFKVSTHLYCRRYPLNTLMAFFQSQSFHGCIMSESSLAVAFGVWLAHYVPDLSPMIALERTIAARRRRHPHPGQKAAWSLNDCVDVLDGPAGLLPHYDEIASRLSSDRSIFLASLLSPTASNPPTLPWDSQETEGIIVDMNPEGGLGHGPPDLMVFLSKLRFGASDTDVRAMLTGQGIESTDAMDVLNQLANDGLIVRRR